MCARQDGCGAWLWNITAAPYTPCTLLVLTGSSDGGVSDSGCPKGYAASVIINKGEDVSIAGRGHCTEETKARKE